MTAARPPPFPPRNFSLVQTRVSLLTSFFPPALFAD